MIPLKSGIYHILTDPNADISSFRYIGLGQTITVEYQNFTYSIYNHTCEYEELK